MEGFEGPVASLSLLSDIVINFKKGNEILSFLLPTRSFLIIDGEARYVWSHGISYRKRARKVDVLNGVEYLRKERIAITYRRVIPK